MVELSPERLSQKQIEIVNSTLSRNNTINSIDKINKFKYKMYNIIYSEAVMITRSNI